MLAAVTPTENCQVAGSSIDFDDLQAYIGIKFAFGSGGASLVERDRSNAYDNTSVMHEKLPNWFDSLIAGSSGP